MQRSFRQPKKEMPLKMTSRILGEAAVDSCENWRGRSREEDSNLKEENLKTRIHRIEIQLGRELIVTVPFI